MEFWNPKKTSAFNLNPSPVSPVKINLFPVRSPGENKLINKNPYGDKDKDGVINFFDCRPSDKNKQEFDFKTSTVKDFHKIINPRQKKIRFQAQSNKMKQFWSERTPAEKHALTSTSMEALQTMPEAKKRFGELASEAQKEFWNRLRFNERNKLLKRLSRAGKKQWVNISPEERSKRLKQIISKVPKEKLSQMQSIKSKKRWEKYSPEERSTFMREQVWNKLTPQQVEEYKKRGREKWRKMSSEERQLNINRMLESRTPEERSIDVKKAWASKTAEERRAIAVRREAQLSPEVKELRAKRKSEAMKKTLALKKINTTVSSSEI